MSGSGLDAATIERLRQLGHASLHDIWFHSLYLGEPLMCCGVLAYFDGRAVTIIGHPLDTCPPHSRSELSAIAFAWAECESVESIEFVGPECVDFRCLHKAGFTRTMSVPRSRISAEMSINCTASADLFSTQTFRRAMARPFSVAHKKADFMTAQQFSLVERFYRIRKRSGYLAATAVAWPAAFRLEDVTLIEARAGERLAGFVALHHAFRDTAVGIFMAHDDTPHVADFLYAQMLCHGRESNLQAINVDSSPTVGSFRFKQKCHGKPCVPPYYFTRWSRGLMTRRVHSGWGARLLGR